jgi:glucose-6-phosphate isomerase
LIPAGVAGLSLTGLRNGAASVITQLQTASNPTDCPPLAGAMVAYALMRQGYSQSVMMPYCDRLAKVSAWYCQLWAESLGKDGQGQTPIRSIGAVDQHSQLQLFLDGPKDKLISLLLLDQSGDGPAIPADMSGDASLDYLDGHTMGDLMAAEQHATAETLAAKGRPVRSFWLDGINETSMGALLMHFMLETIAMAKLMGVNPFDQPAVEEGKERTRAYLNQKATA